MTYLQIQKADNRIVGQSISPRNPDPNEWFYEIAIDAPVDFQPSLTEGKWYYSAGEFIDATGVPASNLPMPWSAFRRDADGYGLVRVEDSIEGAGPWFFSANMADGGQTDWPDTDVAQRIVPLPGTRLVLTTTKMVYDSSVVLGAKPVLFQIKVNGAVYRERVYDDVWKYRMNCDQMRELSWGGMAHWSYSPPIVLSAAEGASLDVYFPQGALDGEFAFLKITARALVEP